jgi:hypothetical protein
MILPKSKPLSLVAQNLSTSLFNYEEDHRYFEIFCTKTAFEILPLMDSEPLRQIGDATSLHIGTIYSACYRCFGKSLLYLIFPLTDGSVDDVSTSYTINQPEV